MGSRLGNALPRFVSAGEALHDFIRLDGDRWLARAGGAGWNVARVMGTFGVPTAFAGAVSADRFGDELARLSAACGLDLRFLQRYPKPPLLAMVHEADPPQYFFIGNGSADLEFDPGGLPAEWVEKVEWVHFGGISLTREPLRSRLLLVLDAVKAAGKRVSYDPNFRYVMTAAYDETLRYVAKRADLVKVSDEDLCGLFRTADPVAGLAQLRSLNPTAPILLTRGAEGAELHGANGVLRQRPPTVSVADTVGAGDASVGGMLYSMMSEPASGWPAHLRFAVAAASAACLNPGASPPSLSLVREVLRRFD